MHRRTQKCNPMKEYGHTHTYTLTDIQFSIVTPDIKSFNYVKRWIKGAEKEAVHANVKVHF